MNRNLSDTVTNGGTSAAKQTRPLPAKATELLNDRNGIMPCWVRSPKIGAEYYSGFSRAKLYELAGAGKIRSVSITLCKFRRTDVVWIGGLQDSGRPESAGNFKTVEEWLKCNRAPGQFICPANFKNNSIARSNANIVDRRFLVVESDVLNKNEVGAVFRFLMECGLILVAVVDTAGKSLHGWFDYPSCESALDELKLILPALKCDPKLFTASQPVRLPGAVRDGKFQRLIYSRTESCI